MNDAMCLASEVAFGIGGSLSGMNLDSMVTAVATLALAVVGIMQVIILSSQRRQGQLLLIEEYRKRWLQSNHSWGILVFIGRNDGEYYQILDESKLATIRDDENTSNCGRPTIWALDAVRVVCSLLSDICVNLLEGKLRISDVYSLFGTELLRHGRPLRTILDNAYNHSGFTLSHKHSSVREEARDWLVYHDGIRRRCLILIDLLWAEAVRLDDLPPSDVKYAAEAKKVTGKFNKRRLYSECIRLGGYQNIFLAFTLTQFLKHSEYKSVKFCIGIDPKKLEIREKEWVDLLLRNFNRQ